MLTIASVIEEDALERLRQMAAKLTWRDGSVTAGATARAVKQNEQADLSSPAGRTVTKMVTEAITSHPVFKAAARPKRLSNLIMSRTANGGHYGAHVDNALMRRNGELFRTDLSFTLFLTEPEDYDGGDLVIHQAGVRQAAKGQAGDLILYPSSSIHEVMPVTRGERLVCIGWVESCVEDERCREMLFDLENLRVSLRATLPPQSAELLILDKTMANLLRMWANP